MDLEQLELISVAGGTRLRLRVKPRSRKNSILGVHDGALKVSVMAAPERGKGNRAVAKLLARLLEIPLQDVRILSGASSQDKVVLIPLSPAAVGRLLAQD